MMAFAVGTLILIVGFWFVMFVIAFPIEAAILFLVGLLGYVIGKAMGL